MNTYVVETEHLVHNITALKKRAGSVPIWAVVKGNGYGLGILPLARLLRAQGITRFCITEVEEARLLRENGFPDVTILMLRSLTDPEALEQLISLNVILTVGSMEAAEMAQQAAERLGRNAEIHIKIDTGMGRFGFLPEDVSAVATVYSGYSALMPVGIYTHFNCAFQEEALTRQEYAAFRSLVDGLIRQGIDPGIVHCCNSAAFLRFPEMHESGVRLGSAILGRMSFQTELKPVGYVETTVDVVRTLPAGHTTGYSALWRAKKPTPIAILPIGWYHGFHVSCQPDRSRGRDNLRSALSSLRRLLRPERTYITINGKSCPLVGSIGMLHCAVDVSGVSCQAGDTVRLPINPLHLNGMQVEYR